MTKHRDLKLEKYNISRSRYRELYYFCLQYDERKRKMEELRYSSPPQNDGMPRGSGTSNPTERNGILSAYLAMENDIIEQAAKEADESMSFWILKAAKEGKDYNNLKTFHDMPCSEREFLRLRRKFFYILDQKKINL